MKTTILISSFASLCLMITFAESPSRPGAETSNTLPVNRISLVPSGRFHTFQGNKSSITKVISAVGKTLVPEAKDFGYLKFKVTQFMEKDDPYTESGLFTALPEPDGSYLKFDVNDYSDNAECSSTEALELPEDDFAYLRIDTGSYTETNPEWFESIDLPADNFNYLKFNVSVYVGKNELEAGTTGELPYTESKPSISL